MRRNMACPHCGEVFSVTVMNFLTVEKEPVVGYNKPEYQKKKTIYYSEQPEKKASEVKKL